MWSLLRTSRVSFILTLVLLLSVAPTAPGSGQETDEALIRLDPICRPIEARYPTFAPGTPAPGTRRMAERLSKLQEQVQDTPEALFFLNDRRVAQLEEQLARATSLDEQMKLAAELAIQQVDAGRPDLGLNTLAVLRQTVQNRGLRLGEQTVAQLRMRRALAFLRLGEQENCLAQHNAESCLFPLSRDAVHTLKRGARGAAALYREQLAAFPDDLNARWMLNLVAMTLGEYPDKVPAEFLMPPSVFAAEHPLPAFRDISHGLGFDFDTLAGGVILDDFDNDGFYDVVLSSWEFKGQLRYFHNQGNGTFAEKTSEAGLVGETAALNIQQTDFNNDGLLDLWLLRGGWFGKAGRMPSSLLRNNGDGSFADVTEEAGLLRFHPTQTSRWFDYDGDGWLDLFIGNESTDPNDPDGCELFHNNRDGTFTECAEASGIRVATIVKAVACADYDNDGRPDLYLSVRTGPNLLFHNDGPDLTGRWRFSNATAKAGVEQPIYSFPTWFFDYDNDGWEDLFVSGYLLPRGVGDVAADYLGRTNTGVKPKLYRNNHDGTFTDATAAMRLDRICHSMGANYGDLDNDGWLDFYAGTGDPNLGTLVPSRTFRNAGGRRFQDVSGATRTGHLQKGHGVAFADLNDDGAQELFAMLGGAFTGDPAKNALFLNPGNTNRFLKLKLVGTKANRPALGARITVTVRTPSGRREIHRTLSSGGSFGSSPLRQEIGLGDAVVIESVAIRWPGSDTRSTHSGLELNHSYQIREGDDRPTPVPLRLVNLVHLAPQ
jgi:hypothetical protein